jgi:conjugative relaxase-like TrwC/TraI family protein
VLSVGTVSAGNAAQREYHERQLAEARDDYYRESEGPPGVWVGAFTARLGVEGEVSLEQFRRLLDGRHPDTGESFSDSMGRRKTVAFDLAFSAPKSVSLLRMAADEHTSKTIDLTHDRAVRAALAYIEAEGWKGRELRDGERITTDGTGVIGVLYRHETTRNADPQLHSHAVLANLVDDGGGRVRAINSQVLYWQAKTAGTVYQAVLRGELHDRLGLRFDVPVNGLADIEGFDRGLIETFSTRRGEILQALGRAGLPSSSKTATERAALESRRAKDRTLDHTQWRLETRSTLRAAGLGPDAADRLIGTPAAGTVGERDAEIGNRIAAAPLDQVTRERATEDARAIRQAAMNVSGGYTYAEVGEALTKVFSDDRLVQIQDGDRPRWTTARHLRLEHRVEQSALGRMQETNAPRIDRDDYTVPSATPEGHGLSPEQRRVLAQILKSGRGVEVVRARAGAGKTTIAGLARSEFERHGFRVMGVAPTLQALAELDDVGVATKDSLARTALSGGEFSTVMRNMDHRTVVLVDEAAMAQTKDIAPLLDRAADCGAKVVAIGDDGQLAAVGAGGWFRYLVEHREAPVLELTEVYRQRDPVERDRLNQLHRGDVTGWVRWAGQRDRIHVHRTVEDAYAAAVNRYERALADVDGDVDRVLVMAPDNAHRRALNEQLRRVIVRYGLVDREREENYGGLLVAPGDRLVANATVTDPASGGRVVENGERFEILTTAFGGGQALAVAGQRRGQTVWLPADVLADSSNGRSVDHAYARTVHKAQGMTVDRSILFAPDPGRLGRNLAYVGLTRTRDRADLVTVAPNRLTGLERLVRGMAERRDQRAALAIADPAQLDPERVSRMSDPEVDEHRHTLLTEAREAMARLTRLDREARGAWVGSGEARTTAQLLAQREGLTASIQDRERLLEEQDPDGDRRRRHLMEHTIGQALIRDRAALESVDQRLHGRDASGDIEAADETQQRIRQSRALVADYLASLLERLDHVHSEQIDRTTAHTSPSSVPEHDRPSLALREEAERSERIRRLTLAAAQQLGTGHPTVASWLEGHAPRPPRDTPQRAGEVLPSRFTAAQLAFADALRAWRAERASWTRDGGRGQLDRLENLVDRIDRATQRRDQSFLALRAHEGSEPSWLRRGAHAQWQTTRTSLSGVANERQRRMDDLDRERKHAEREVGRPIATALRESYGAQQRVIGLARTAREREQNLFRGGPTGLGIERATRTLGRRDDLDPADQRRYDQLAGRMAIQQVLDCEPAVNQADCWRSALASDLRRDVAGWRDAHDLPLEPSGQRTVRRQDGVDFGLGPEMGY